MQILYTHHTHIDFFYSPTYTRYTGMRDQTIAAQGTLPRRVRGARAQACRSKKSNHTKYIPLIFCIPAVRFAENIRNTS
jgi:hypothetical protein